MDLKHTKGNWVIHKNNSFFEVNSRLSGKRMSISCHLTKNDDGFHYSDSHSEENEANAKLIAASPDLLQAIIELNRQIDTYWNEDKSDKQVKAISKAQQKSLKAINKVIK